MLNIQRFFCITPPQASSAQGLIASPLRNLICCITSNGDRKTGGESSVLPVMGIDNAAAAIAGIMGQNGPRQRQETNQARRK
mmetsp:Transcript_33700/g.100439  ORF Transcript_33700/g.100439 Transcript_33700/m.100439 type:complete len:82 (+) Transcript_33700:1231-1476(+)